MSNAPSTSGSASPVDLTDLKGYIAGQARLTDAERRTYLAAIAAEERASGDAETFVLSPELQARLLQLFRTQKEEAGKRAEAEERAELEPDAPPVQSQENEDAETQVILDEFQADEERALLAWKQTLSQLDANNEANVRANDEAKQRADLERFLQSGSGNANLTA